MIHVIPVLNDNYIFLVETNSGYICVDPAISKPVIDFCKDKPVTNILITHHHNDHTGGVSELKKHFNCSVYAAKYDKNRISDVDHWVENLDSITIKNLEFKVYHTPGHTLGHIIFYCKELKALFCGDTLFRLGCGRLFEGSYEQMYNSINLIKTLPAETKIYCTHEYTENNLNFCIHHKFISSELEIEAQNILNLRQQQTPTVPVKLDLELKTNPFFNPKSYYPDLSPLQAFEKLRQLRDDW